MKMKTATIKQFDDGTFCGRIKEIQEDGTAPDIAVNFGLKILSQTSTAKSITAPEKVAD
jgi:hypothetical protein